MSDSQGTSGGTMAALGSSLERHNLDNFLTTSRQRAAPGRGADAAYWAWPTGPGRHARPRAAGRRRRHPLPVQVQVAAGPACLGVVRPAALHAADRIPPTTTGDSVSAAPTPPGAAAKPPAIRRREAAHRGAWGSWGNSPAE